MVGSGAAFVHHLKMCLQPHQRITQLCLEGRTAVPDYAMTKRPIGIIP